MADEFTAPTKTTAPADKAGAGASPQDVNFFFTLVKNMKNKIEVDWDVVASQLRLKNGRVATVSQGSFHQAQRP